MMQTARNEHNPWLVFLFVGRSFCLSSAHAQKPVDHVILSGAKDLLLCVFIREAAGASLRSPGRR